MTTIHELETPSVLIDLDRMQANIQRMQARCNDLGLGFRPHIKTHKIPDIAKMQMEAGAKGIACQKVSEAEVFAQAGIDDILIPYNIIGVKKAARLADLALYNKVSVSADSAAVIDGLAEAARANEMSIRVLVDLGTEIGRTGVEPEQVVALAQRIDRDENLHFSGIMLYPSNPVMRGKLQEALALLDRAGLDADVVSGGGFGASQHAHEMPELTEIRVGTYVFNDYMCIMNGTSTVDDCAAVVAATVVSHPTPDRAILDAGSKTLTSETVNNRHGYILEYPDGIIYKLNEEHAYVDLSACQDRPAVGDRVHVIPVHVCVMMNLHNQVYGIRGENVEVMWPVAARGMVW